MSYEIKLGENKKWCIVKNLEDGSQEAIGPTYIRYTHMLLWALRNKISRDEIKDSDLY